MAAKTDYDSQIKSAMEMGGLSCPPFSLTAIQMALRAAIELNVFNILAKSGPLGTQLTAAQILSKIPKANSNAASFLNRILRYISISSYLTTSFPPGSTREDERLFGLTPLTSGMLVQPEGGDMPLVATLVLTNTEKEIMDGFSKLKDAVLSPQGPPTCPFVLSHGVGMYDYISKRPGSRLATLFDQTMDLTTRSFFDNEIRLYGGFSEVEELLDVGGSTGTALERIISVYPNVKGINFDLPHIIDQAPPLKGVRHVAGDMFESLPSSKTILMKCVLHNWSDEQCLKLLRNCWRALPKEGGKVIVMEFVVPRDLKTNDRGTMDAISLDFIMLSIYGGKERTASEFRDLGVAAGFSDIKVIPLHNGVHALEYLKK